MSEAIIDIKNLSRTFGKKHALDNLSLSVPHRSVFGLVGENGAGKSTLIKHILGLFRAQQGSVKVFGSDPVTEPVPVLERIGYLSEEPELPGWMSIEELMNYTEAFYPTWDAVYAQELLSQFSLDRGAIVKTLSKGQLAKAGLLLAQAHRPDLLLLDEPSSGLDPIVRKDILTAVIRTAADEGRTVFFSSHLLEEIERVSDFIAMINGGRLVLCGPIEDVKRQHRHLVVRFKAEPQPVRIPGSVCLRGSGLERSLLCNLNSVEPNELLADLAATLVDEDFASLDDIFLLHAGKVLGNAPIEASFRD